MLLCSFLFFVMYSAHAPFYFYKINKRIEFTHQIIFLYPQQIFYQKVKKIKCKRNGEHANLQECLSHELIVCTVGVHVFRG